MDTEMDVEVRTRINQALAGRKYLVTVTYIEGDQFEHYVAMKEFPDGGIQPTISQLAQLIMNSTKLKSEESTG